MGGTEVVVVGEVKFPRCEISSAVRWAADSSEQGCGLAYISRDTALALLLENQETTSSRQHLFADEML